LILVLARGVRWLLGPAVALALAACAVGPSVAPPATPTPAPAAPTPQPTPAPAPLPPVSVPQRDDARPPVVRVLLQSAPEPVLPDPGRRYVCVTGEAVTMVRGPLSVKLVAGRAVVQVGAFGREENALAMVARLTATGFEVRVEGQGDALRRVVALGRENESDDGLAQRLAQAGFADQKRVTTSFGGGLVVVGEDGATIRTELVRLVPVDLQPVRVGGKTVRGELELRPGSGGVTVINVVNLEEYLRGVVPAEMGPRAFPNLEALKAQAVAARTYAVAHLGEHAADSYDLCDSQACQVYEGAGAEQPLTDRAVQETAGEIATFQGKPIDAMYQSTCAGHTEDAAALFPDRAQPYLKGVPCRGERLLSVGAGTAVGPWFGALERLSAVAETLAAASGVPREPRALAARLSGTHPGPGVAGLVRAFGLEGTAATLRVEQGKGAEDGALEMMRTFRLPLPPAPAAGSRSSWELALVVRLAQLAGTIQAVSGRLVPGPQGVRLVNDGTEPPRELTGREAVLERRGERWRRGATASFASGSPATLWCAGTLCPLVEVEPLEAADDGSAWTWWVRELTLDEISRRLGVPGVRSVAVLRRGVSGRALAVGVATASESKEFPGMAFRRALELPDTLFVTVPSRSAAGASVRFLGRGWGHGVGMCQNGAYGLARGGATYTEILKTYYTGIEVARWEGGNP
jgi:peptidoglycan hydrolase-like amidase